MKTLSCTQMLTTGLLVCSCVAAHANPLNAAATRLHAATVEEIFDTLDTDQDRILSIKEASRSPNLLKIFIKIDNNQDQYVTMDEYRTYRSVQAKKSG